MAKGKIISDEKLLQSLLLCGGAVKVAAADLSISENAIYKRLREPEFRAQYDSLQGAVLAAAAAAMVHRMDKAVDALAAVLDDENAAPGVKVTAANYLLSHGLRYVETANILRRLEALEAQTDERS